MFRKLTPAKLTEKALEIGINLSLKLYDEDPVPIIGGFLELGILSASHDEMLTQHDLLNLYADNFILEKLSHLFIEASYPDSSHIALLTDQCHRFSNDCSAEQAAFCKYILLGIGLYINLCGIDDKKFITTINQTLKTIPASTVTENHIEKYYENFQKQIAAISVTLTENLEAYANSLYNSLNAAATQLPDSLRQMYTKPIPPSKTYYDYSKQLASYYAGYSTEEVDITAVKNHMDNYISHSHSSTHNLFILFRAFQKTNTICATISKQKSAGKTSLDLVIAVKDELQKETFIRPEKLPQQANSYYSLFYGTPFDKINSALIDFEKLTTLPKDKDSFSLENIRPVK